MSDEGHGGYLVSGKDGDHLPTRINGKLDHGLPGAAHAALFKSFRGKSYEGPDKEAAKAKLRALYKEAGLEWPSDGASENSEQQIRFLVALGEMASEGTVRLPIAITGEWTHPATKQEIRITAADLETAIGNFEKKANGEINVDYDHASAMPNLVGDARPSAGRVVALEAPQPFTDSKGVQRQILYGSYEPTSKARTLIANNEYRYVSPVLDPKRIDKATGEAQGMTVTTIALTNTPVLEEMPRIHLAEQGFVDVGSVHVESTDSGASQNNPPAASSEGNLKEAKHMTKKLSMVKCDDGAAIMDDGTQLGYVPHSDVKGYHKAHIATGGDEALGSEQRFAQFLSDVGFTGSTADEVKAMLQAGVRAQDAEKRSESRRLLLSECIAGPNIDEAKASQFLADHKITIEDYRSGREGERRVRKLIDAGKMPARMGGDALKLFLSDAGLFKTLIEERPAPLNLKPTGASDGPSGNSASDFLRMVEMRQKEKSCSYGVALSDVSREHPEMARAYQEAVRNDRQ